MYDDKNYEIRTSECGRFQLHTQRDLARIMSPQETG